MSVVWTLPRRLAPAMPRWSKEKKNQKKKDVWCHPITTQAAADSTHGEAVGVHAFKQRGGEEQQPAPRKELKTFPAE